MIVQITFIVGGIVAIGLGLAIAWAALSAALEPPAERVTIPVEESREHLPR